MAIGFLLLVGVLYILLQLPYVQTSLVRYVTERIEKTTGVHIQVGGVDFRPMSSLVLNDVLLKDFKNDTLVYCQSLQVKADSFNLRNRSFHIREILLDKATFHLWISRGEDGASTNIERFIDSLQKGQAAVVADKDAPESGNRWLMGLKKISIRNSRFTYREEDYEPVDYGVNWTDVDCRDLNVDLSDFNFMGSPTEISVSGLSLNEKSGLQIKEMQARVSVGEGDMLVSNCRFQLARSEVDLIKLQFNWTPGQHDWRNFITNMQQYYELGPSSVSFIDMAYFNGVLRGIDNTVLCSGVVTGTIDHLEGHDLYFELGEKSVFQGSFKSQGLPDVRNTLFHIEMRKAHLKPDDLETVYLPWFDMNIPVPSLLHNLSYIDFDQIKFDGTLSDFIVQAKSVTPALAGDLTFRYYPCENDTVNCVNLGGEFKFENVDCGKLTENPLLGTGMLSGNYAGTWDANGPAIHVNTRLEKIAVYKGNIRNTEVAFTWGNDKIDLIASLNDEVVKGGMVMAYDLGDSLNFLSLKGAIHIQDLESLGIKIKQGKESVSTTFDLIHAGSGDKSFTNLTLSDAFYSDGTDSLMISTISFEDNQLKNHNTTTLCSDFADLSIEGNYREIRPVPFILKMIQNYLPAYTSVKNNGGQQNINLKDYDFQYAVKIKDANPFLRIFCPDLKLSAGATIVSAFHHSDEKLNLHLVADTIDYKGISFLESRIDLDGDTRCLKVNYTADRVVYGAGYRLYNFRNELSIADNHLDNQVTWCNWEQKTYSGELSASVVLSPNEKEKYATEILINPGVIVMNDSIWKVNRSSILFKGKNIQVNDFSIRRGDEFLTVNGQISENQKEKLYVNLKNFNLSNFAHIAFSHWPHLFGMATGSLTIQDYYKDCLLISDFNIDNWGIRNDTLGSLHFRSYWDAEQRSLVVGAKNRIGDTAPLVISGFYTPEADSLDINIKLEKIDLQRFGSYASEYLSQAKGFLSGNVNVTGNTGKPDISGFVYLDSVGVKVRSLNTDFYIHDNIHIENNRLLFHNFILKDAAGNKAAINGDYRIWENRYQLEALFENFRVLNTAFSDNEAFYGEVNLSGGAQINNKGDILNMTINARPASESHLYLPLTAGITEHDNNFLHFLIPGREETRENQPTALSTQNINLNANLELNDYLGVQVIFDPTVGDILKASGSGNLKINFDKDGKLSMFGEYRISRGDYLFTLSNLVNKKFVLTPGGTITWNGSPYDAMLNLNAVYSLKTTITELLPSEKITGDDTDNNDKTSSESNRKVPVECILNLSDNLSNPSVNFDINFPSLETQIKSYIQSLFSSQDELNKQMFSLLILNQFYQPDNITNYGLQAQTAGVTTLTEMFSNQLSRWFSQFSNNVDIGFAYRLGDREKDLTSDELELAVSTQLLNDRITISANGNVDVGNTKNAAAENRKSNIAGDFDVEVKINKPGTLKLKAYSHTNEKPIYNNTEMIQGVGVSYQESFDTLHELLKKYFGFLNRRKIKK